MTSRGTGSVAYSADAWRRPSGMVASAALQAETAAVRRGMLASLVLAAALRAPAGDLDEVDAGALATLLAVLDPAGIVVGATRRDDAYAFARATQAAQPRYGRRAQPADLADDLDTVRNDARLLLKAANATSRRRQTLLRRPELGQAAERLAALFAAVSDAAMTEAGSPGDSIGSLRG